MSSRPINMLEVNRRLLRRLSSPTHAIRSYQQLAMIERLNPDMVTRSMSSLSQFFGGNKLTEVRGNRICTTKLANDVLPLLDQLFSLAERQAHQVETLRVAFTPGTPAQILAPAVRRFIEGWSGAVEPELLMVPYGSQEMVRAKEVALLLSLGEDSPEPDELIDFPVPATFLASADHRLAGVGGFVDSDHLSANDRIFLSPQIADKATKFLAKVPPANLTEIADATLLHHLVSINAGLGLEYAHPIMVGEGFVRLSVVGIESARLGLWLPKGNQLIEPVQSLIVALRDAARDAAMCPLPPLAVPAEAVSLPELPSVPEFPTA